MLSILEREIWSIQNVLTILILNLLLIFKHFKWKHSVYFKILMNTCFRILRFYKFINSSIIVLHFIFNRFFVSLCSF